MPASCAAVGSVENAVAFLSCRKPSKSPKKNARFCTIGPPSVPPYWLRRSGGFDPSAGLKYVSAFSAVSRKNSQPSPWIWLVPLRYATLTVAPAARPYSALWLLVTTRNSLTASGGGCITWFEKPWLLVPYALLSTPSIRKLLNVLRSPFTLNAPSRGVPLVLLLSADCLTPVDSS